MIPTKGLSGPLWIVVKLLTYSKPITGNGTDYEWWDELQKILAQMEPPPSHSSPTITKGQKNQVNSV